MKPARAIQLILVIACTVIVFHLLVLFRVIPYTIVWAGKINTVEQMRVFEMVSLVINLLLIITILIKGKYLKINIHSKIIQVILWIFFILFVLNTIGNLFSKSTFELVVFTPLTLLLALLFYFVLFPSKKTKS